MSIFKGISKIADLLLFGFKRIVKYREKKRREKKINSILNNNSYKSKYNK